MKKSKLPCRLGLMGNQPALTTRFWMLTFQDARNANAFSLALSRSRAVCIRPAMPPEQVFTRRNNSATVFSPG